MQRFIYILVGIVLLVIAWKVLKWLFYIGLILFGGYLVYTFFLARE